MKTEGGVAVDPWSATACFLELLSEVGGKVVQHASGFILKHKDRYFLITNWHVVTGRNPANGEVLPGWPCTPKAVKFSSKSQEDPNQSFTATYSLYDANDNERWLEHPRHGRSVDVVAFPLGVLPSGYIPGHVSLDGPPLPRKLRPLYRVAVVGFPFALSQLDAFGIWTTGFVASEPEIDFNSLPAFLIDARTRPGQSGSLVLNVIENSYVDDAGKAHHQTGIHKQWLGVYSGRIDENSDLGKVWRIEAVREIIDNSGQALSCNADK